MAAGDQITYANYKAMVPEAWRITPSWADQNRTVYLASCSFVIQIRVVSVFLRSASMDIDAYFYNGSGWTLAFSDDVSVSGSYGDESKKFYHNRAAEGTTSGDSHQHHLWKFVIHNVSYAGSAHAYFNIWAGGLETMTEAEYNSYFKGHEIMGIVCQFDDTETVDANFVAVHHPSTHKNTEIAISTGTYKWMCYEA